MNSLQRIVTMAALTAWRAYKTPGALIWKLLLPIALGGGIAFLAGSGSSTAIPTVVVVNEDGTREAEDVIKGLAATPFDVSIETRQQAADEISSGTLEAALIIPEGFAESLKSGTPRIESLHAEGYERGKAEARIATLVRALANGRPINGAAVVLESPRGGERGGEFGQVRSVYGIYLILSMGVLITSACALHTERAEGRLQRTLAAGVPFREVIISLVASVGLIGIIQATGVLAITGLLGAPWLASGWSAIAFPTLGAIAAFSGIAVGIAGFVRSQSQAQIISVGLPILLAYVGGIFWPLEIEPGALQQFASINPLHWSMEALSGGFVYAGPSSQLVPMAILLLTGVLGAVLGVQGLRRMAR